MQHTCAQVWRISSWWINPSHLTLIWIFILQSMKMDWERLKARFMLFFFHSRLSVDIDSDSTGITGDLMKHQDYMLSVFLFQLLFLLPVYSSADLHLEHQALKLSLPADKLPRNSGNFFFFFSRQEIARSTHCPKLESSWSCFQVTTTSVSLSYAPGAGDKIRSCSLLRKIAQGNIPSQTIVKKCGKLAGLQFQVVNESQEELISSDLSFQD